MATKLAIRHQISDFHGLPLPNHKPTSPTPPHDAVHHSPPPPIVRCPQQWLVCPPPPGWPLIVIPSPHSGVLFCPLPSPKKLNAPENMETPPLIFVVNLACMCALLIVIIAIGLVYASFAHPGEIYTSAIVLLLCV